jgi:hypothetical protein
MKISFFLVLIILVASCTKENSKVPDNVVNTNNNDVVVMTGTVSQYDVYDHLTSLNLSTIQVKLIGANFITNCDTNGNFTLTNIPKGTYQIEINKSGFGLTRRNITLNSDYNASYQISEVPQWNMTLGAAHDTTQSFAGVMTAGFSFSVFVNAVDAQTRNVQIYYNNKSGINPLNTGTFKGKNTCWSNPNEATFTFFTPYSQCSTFSASGDTLFYKVCPISYKSSIEDSSSNFLNTSVNVNGPESFFIVP